RTRGSRCACPSSGSVVAVAGLWETLPVPLSTGTLTFRDSVLSWIPNTKARESGNMRATVMYGPGDVRIEDVPDPSIVEPTDAIVRVTRACICGSDLWPYASMEPCAPFMPLLPKN